MKRKFACLAAASIVYGSPHVFSVTDDLLAYPQYEVIFSDAYISDRDASSHLSSLSIVPTTAPSSPDLDAATALSPLQPPPPTNSNPKDDPLTPPATYSRLLLHSTPYLCTIPIVPTPLPSNSSTHALHAAEETAELARATDRGYDLLRSMSNSCLYFISGWWSYSFCYNSQIKQFHQLPPGKGTPIFPPVEDPATPSYILGRFGEVRNRLAEHDAEERGGAGRSGGTDAGLRPERDDEGRTTEIQAKGTSSSRYLSQKLSGGTTCDLTGSPRRVEIQFHCHPQSADRIGWIKEVATCSYLMVVYTPRLCNDVAFLPPREERAEGIVCREIVGEDEVVEWEGRKRREREGRLVGAGAGTAAAKAGESIAVPPAAAAGSGSAPRPIVGNIEVGAMSLVGTEGKRIETPPAAAALPPGSHNHPIPPSDASSAAADLTSTTLITASPASAGSRAKVTRLSDAELRKLGLDPSVVDAARRELEGLAGGKGWMLEVFEVAGRRELRGVVQGEDGEGEEYRGGVGALEEGEGEERGLWDGGEDGDEEGDEDGGEDGDEDEDEEGSQEEYKDEL